MIKEPPLDNESDSGNRSNRNSNVSRSNPWDFLRGIIVAAGIGFLVFHDKVNQDLGLAAIVAITVPSVFNQIWSVFKGKQ